MQDQKKFLRGGLKEGKKEKIFVQGSGKRISVVGQLGKM